MESNYLKILTPPSGSPGQVAPARPWFPLNGEPTLDYNLFKVYLDLGPDRSVGRVAKEMGVKPYRVAELSAKWDWDSRVRAYEYHLAEGEFDAREEEIIAQGVDWERRRATIREKAYQNSNKLIEKAMAMLEFPLEMMTESVVEGEDEEGRKLITTIVHMPVKWSLRDAASMLTVANQLQRLAADMSTSNTTVSIQEKRVDLTIQLILDLTSKGVTLPEARQRLLEVGVDEVDLDIAVKKVNQGVTPNGK